MSIVGTLMEVALGLRSLIGGFSKAKAERRRQAADYYQAVGGTIDAVADSLEAGDVPHGHCQRLVVHAQQLPGAIGDVIGQEKAAEMSRRLEEAHDVEGMAAELLQGATPEERDEELRKLREAAGIFGAMADVLRASR
jgi:hypothetical protein